MQFAGHGRRSWSWWLVARRAVRSDRLYIFLHSSRSACASLNVQHSVERLVPELPVEALVAPVLPRASGLYEEGLSSDLLDPFPLLPGCELRPVVRADLFGHASAHRRLGERCQHIIRSQPVRHLYCQALPAPLIDHRE